MSITANELVSFHLTHPGEMIKDELEYRRITQRKLAMQMDIGGPALNEVLNAHRPVTAEFAILVEAALDISSEMLVNMQTRYNLTKARKDKNLIKRVAKIRDTCTLF